MSEREGEREREREREKERERDHSQEYASGILFVKCISRTRFKVAGRGFTDYISFLSGKDKVISTLYSSSIRLSVSHTMGRDLYPTQNI